ncbi:DUF397 domain-containing protein [Actinomadura parmotrematis]|uniref:DUF397 domain-containing protein n=1 Tax=Actinomadura parmotrematis TaxID=2864039 RepID=A0ABS7G2A9_9ACTN|nr:DUF397 domain-containing protein [Actinomadura parmotrematis]MBW8486853.1 DUF397 domain-containing protein [Actinomadura parmotrematis]
MISQGGAGEIVWRKSSRSDSTGCVSLASLDACILVRDSRDPGRARLALSRSGAAALLEAIRSGRLDSSAGAGDQTGMG